MKKHGKGRGIQLRQKVDRTARGSAPSGSWWLDKDREAFQIALAEETPRLIGDYRTVWPNANGKHS